MLVVKKELKINSATCWFFFSGCFSLYYFLSILKFRTESFDDEQKTCSKHVDVNR